MLGSSRCDASQRQQTKTATGTTVATALASEMPDVPSYSAWSASAQAMLDTRTPSSVTHGPEVGADTRGDTAVVLGRVEARCDAICARMRRSPFLLLFLLPDGVPGINDAGCAVGRMALGALICAASGELRNTAATGVTCWSAGADGGGIAVVLTGGFAAQGGGGDGGA
jgi:hypothetical protein